MEIKTGHSNSPDPLQELENDELQEWERLYSNLDERSRPRYSDQSVDTREDDGG